MIQLKKLFVALAASVVCASLSSCASVEIPELHPHITLPANQSGFWVNTLKEEEGEIPPAEWKIKLETEPHIILFSKDWATLRYVILKNCLTMACKQSVGTLDALFEAADAALKKKKSLLGLELDLPVMPMSEMILLGAVSSTGPLDRETP